MFQPGGRRQADRRRRGRPSAQERRASGRLLLPGRRDGGGVCPINFCGTLATQNALALNPPGYGQSGADSICNGGRVCVVGPAVPTGDAFQLDCAVPTAGALSFGAPCSANPASGMRCANDSLCIATADFSSQYFCATMCRNDADCPTSSVCLEYLTAPAPDGSPAKVGMCTPTSKIAVTPCARERLLVEAARWRSSRGVRLLRDADLADRLQGDRRHQDGRTVLHEQRRLPERRLL